MSLKLSILKYGKENLRAVIQRVKKANVSVSDKTVGKCGVGASLLVCAMKNNLNEFEKLASKIIKMRIYQDDKQKMNRSLLDIGGSALVISQFTLAAD